MSRHPLFVLRPCVLVTLTIALAACDGDPIAGPSGADGAGTHISDARMPDQPSSVRGTALDYTIPGDPRPVPNLRLEVTQLQNGNRLPDVITDANGRYTISGISSLNIVLRTAPESEHRFLCEEHPIYTPEGQRFEHHLPLMHVTWSGDFARLPPEIWRWIPATSVYGRVTERVGDVLVPIPGATVTLDNAERGEPAATTNAMGFYMICSVWLADATRTVRASKDGYDTVARQFVAGWEWKVDLELGDRANRLNPTSLNAELIRSTLKACGLARCASPSSRTSSSSRSSWACSGGRGSA